MSAPTLSTIARAALALAVAAALVGCGGGGDGGGNPPVGACALDEQKSSLRQYFDDEYLWYATRANPDPALSPTITAYFDALLTPGVTGNRDLPADRWSYTESTASHDLFYGDGRTLGYGLSVAGLEVAQQPNLPLRVRYIEPASPAADAGVLRGETIVSINGRSSADIIAADDYSALMPSAAGEVLRLVLRDAAGADRSVDVVSRVYDLTPLPGHRIVASPNGRKIGYVVLKDFIAQSEAPMETAFADFKANGVNEIVLDLRYNGGGLVSVARALASYAGGAARAPSQPFATLRYSDKRQGRNSTFAFPAAGTLASAAATTRVFVLSGARTCSASELVVNGLKPFVDVVQIGDVTCGKPVGFVPTDNCGTTYSAVNFESVNAAGTGRYWDGIAPTCAVADDLDHALGDPDEALLAAARGYVDSGACPVASARERPTGLLREVRRRIDEGERSGMVGR